MGSYYSTNRLAGKPMSEMPAAPSTTRPPGEVRVPEVTATELLAQQGHRYAPVLLDCREEVEWQQLRIPGSMHIPMRQIPHRLAELDQHVNIVVVCAHGERSYRMAGYLIEQGFCARSLRGGLAEWLAKGGPVETDRRPS